MRPSYGHAVTGRQGSILLNTGFFSSYCTGYCQPVGFICLSLFRLSSLRCAGSGVSYLEFIIFQNQREVDSGPSGRMGAMLTCARQYVDCATGALPSGASIPMQRQTVQDAYPSSIFVVYGER